MGKSARNFKNSCISPHPSFFLHFLAVSPKKSSRNQSPNFTLLFLLSLFTLSSFLGICVLTFYGIPHNSIPCPPISPSSPLSPILLASLSSISKGYPRNDEPTLLSSVMVPLPAHGVAANLNLSAEEKEFWQQPDGEGYRPCLDFSLAYRKASARISKEKRKLLVMVVSGGLNQQRNQIVDAVVIARILEAALVVPVLQVNRIWGDESEFSDIFDLEHFKKTLQADVRVVSSLPSTHLVSMQSIENQIPFHVSPMWIRARYFHQLNEEGFLILKGLDSRLSKNLPPDLQKLRCKVAFHALRFTSPIQDLGNQIARRMWIEGPYIALHLRIEKDVWIRTGFCPLSAKEVARLLRGLGAPSNARIYVAGGEPFGGSRAIQPLVHEFPNIATKKTLARQGELTPYLNRPSVLAAIDYIVSLSSDVFLPSHGGNMGRAMQGHRAYVGHRKYIKPNKRMIVPLLEDTSVSDEKFRRTMQKLHKYSKGQPESRKKKLDRDVLAYPVPECMCKH
ncbi:O-fucosyltransferase 37 [Sesamum angolense]|uniref:O-fucosyltransferase family protein n=1 Tax=Sesamum angolense TaxID=2727404 RepID=A0AAE1XBX9_9LAMI|nr:O-fucosyltransferase 37 [Sesamum angolense]